MLAKAMVKLRSLRPFYSAIYESMEKKCTSLVPTMGVDCNTLYYNEQFIESLEFTEFMFINLHEIAHIALMHVARRESRDLQLWNIACDLYVNSSIIAEFGLQVGQSTPIGGFIEIKVPTDLCYCSSLDLEKDYTEAIYEDLVRQGNENGYFSRKPGTYTFKYEGSNKIESDVLSRYRNSNSEYSTFEIKIETSSSGSGSGPNDLLDNGEDQATKEQKSRKIMSDAVVRSEMSGHSVGSGSSNIERIVKDLLKSKLNWKKLFKKYLVACTSADSSFSNPDKRMHYQKAIYPGQSTEDSNFIAGIKLCIDTSGSISTQDMSGFYYQVYDILKKYKVDAELVYWDAEVKSAGAVSSFREFERIDCFGGGGTDPAVVFDYFNSTKVKPKVILMFTDGYFYTDWCKNINKKKYNDTIWIMTKNYNKDFNPPFGRVAVAEFK